MDFSDVVRTYKNKVYNTCLGLVKHPEDAEDLAQEVFIEVYKKMETFRGEAELGTWLYRIAVNKALAYLRRNHTHKRAAAISDTEGLETKEGSQFYHPGATLENKERAAILFDAIEHLPPAQRVAFTLQKLEGLSVLEMAEILEKSASSVESLLFRAKENLRKRLKAYYEANEIER